jgi:ketosteroid isomerase-like protein
MPTGETAAEVARRFVALLGRKDGAGLAALWGGDGVSYADPCRPAVSQGREGVAGHLRALCEALGDAAVVLVDVVAEGERSCVRWVATRPAPGAHVLDAVTLLRLDGTGRVAEARSFFDASLFLPPEGARAGEDRGGTAARTARPAALTLRAEDSRGKAYDVAVFHGRVMCILCAGRAVQDHAQDLALTLGEYFSGDVRVLLTFLLDATDVPPWLRPVARSAMATMRRAAVKAFREGFAAAGKGVPADVEEMVWFVPDYDGSLFKTLGVDLPLKTAVLALVRPDGKVAGVFQGSGTRPAHDAAAACRGIL